MWLLLIYGFIGRSVTSCRMLQPRFGLRAWTVVAANTRRGITPLLFTAVWIGVFLQIIGVTKHLQIEATTQTCKRQFYGSSDFLTFLVFRPWVGPVRVAYEGFHCNLLKCLRNNKFCVGSCIKCIRRLSSIEVKPGRTRCTVIALSDKSRTLDK